MSARIEVRAGFLDGLPTISIHQGNDAIALAPDEAQSLLEATKYPFFIKHPKFGVFLFTECTMRAIRPLLVRAIAALEAAKSGHVVDLSSATGANLEN